MKTLNKETWNNFFTDKEHYLNYRAKWAELTQKAEKGEIELTATDYLRNAILRGRDWKKGFSMHEPHKHGRPSPCAPYGAIGTSFRNIKSGLGKFDGLITIDMIDEALTHVNIPSSEKQFMEMDSYTEGGE